MKSTLVSEVRINTSRKQVWLYQLTCIHEVCWFNRNTPDPTAHYQTPFTTHSYDTNTEQKPEQNMEFSTTN